MPIGYSDKVVSPQEIKNLPVVKTEDLTAQTTGVYSNPTPSVPA